MNPAALKVNIGDLVENGTLIVRTTARKRDVITGEEDVVPQSVWSDGHWLWTDEVTYYVERHGLRPNAAFVDQLAASPSPPPPLSEQRQAEIRAELGF